MRGQQWFDDIPVLGSMTPADAARKLREVGEEALATALDAEANAALWPQAQRTLGLKDWLGRGEGVYMSTSHAFGYVPPVRFPADIIPVLHAGAVRPDTTLKGSRVKITLDRLRAADYPGAGMHHILFDFYAQHQVPESVEHLHFNMTVRVREGEQAPIIGYPIFVGLKVGSEGVMLQCFTVNVKNEQDESLLAIFDSDSFRSGLKLATVAQPAIGPLTDFASGLTRAIAKRNRNVPVQNFYMGLDFSDSAFRARLAEGSYIALQIPESALSSWDWNDWGYHPASGELKSVAQSVAVPYNYIVFSVSRYQEP
jgi:hypothetical protein